MLLFSRGTLRTAPLVFFGSQLMHKIIDSVGGRKSFLVLLAVLIVALSNLLELDERKLELILYLCVGGAGTIAIEDSVKSLRGNGPPK